MTLARTAGAACLAAAALTTLTGLTGCAPLLIGGAMVGGVLVATDRRTTGAQVEDQGIELKAINRVREVLPSAHISVTSYNRLVLLTGEVPSEGDRLLAEQTVARVDNVRSIVNELAVAGNSSLPARSNDALLTSKVKASFVDSKDVFANVTKVVTERGTVYLMGRVTEREAARATAMASTIPGVLKVVRVFEILTEDELARLPAPAIK